MRRFLPAVFLALAVIACGSASPTPLSTGTLRNPLDAEQFTALEGFDFRLQGYTLDPELECVLGVTCVPDENMRFIEVYYDVICRDVTCTFDADRWQIADNNGVLHDVIGYDAGAGQFLGDLELVNGGQSNAELAFEVPTDGAPYVLVYDGAIYFALPAVLP